jgi:hypothetical protein
MKRIILAMFIAASTLYTLSSRGQGSLAPSSPPGPTMLTLAQIEPRTPISAVPYIITQPGSYYLTTNITVSSGNAISIATSNVTLDLSGFAISSTTATAAGYGILINGGSRNITIAHGIIQGSVTNNGSGAYSGSGFAYGIYYSGNAPVNVQISHVSVSGCEDYGIFIGNADSTVVESCTVRTVGQYGIVACIIKQSSAVDCGNDAIDGDAVSDCYGQSSDSSGCVAGETALNCVGVSDGGENGVSAPSAMNCHGFTFSGGGYGVSASIAQNCYGEYSGTGTGDGINANSAENCYGYYNGSGSGDGIYAYNLENCYGFDNGTGAGINALEIANGCYGYSASGVGVDAFIASLCVGVGSTPYSTSHNINTF